MGQVTWGGGSKHQGCMKGVRKRENLRKEDVDDGVEGCRGRYQSIWGKRNRCGSLLHRLTKDSSG